MESLQVLLWAMVGSVVSLVGGIIMIGNRQIRDKAHRWALPFGAGALLAAAFLSALPEALHGQDAQKIMIFAMAGFLAFFILERLLGWWHHHHHDEVHGQRDKTHMALVVVGDTLHNAIDGIALGAAFLVNPSVGITTSLAIAAHEVPQEIGDFGILLGKGMKPRRVVLVNLASALVTVITAMLTFWLGGLAGLDPAPFLAVAAGMFIYTAASDLIPDIHEQPIKEGNLQALMLLVGVLVIGSVALAMPHEHAGSHNEHEHHHQVVDEP